MFTQDKKEMLVHVPFCSHPDIKDVLIFGIEGLEDEIKKHPQINVEYEQIQTYSPKKNGYDIIIAQDMENLDEIGLAKIETSLRQTGIFIGSDLSWSKDTKKTLEQMKKFDKFNIVMPYMYGWGLGDKSQGAILFCSNKFHPTADIVLQKADLLDGLEYYNSDIHKASFSLPTGTKKALLEALKI